MLIHNITICNIYIYIYIQGLCGSVLGPTLLDLRDLLDTTISSMSLLFIVRSIGAITGSFSGNETLRFENLTLNRLLQHCFNNILAPSDRLIPDFFSIQLDFCLIDILDIGTCYFLLIPLHWDQPLQ